MLENARRDYQWICFRIIGFDIFATTNMHVAPFQTFLMMIIQCVVFLYIVPMSALAHVGYMGKMSADLAIFAGGSTAIIKMAFFIIRKKPCLDLLVNYRYLIKSESLKDSNCEDIAKAVDKEHQQLNKIFSMCGLFTIIASISIPIVQTTYTYLRTGEAIYYTPMVSPYPYPIHTPMVYLFSIMLSSIAEVFTMGVYNSLGMLFFSFTHYSVVLFRIIQYRVQNMRADEAHLIPEIIQLHQKVLKLIDGVNTSFQPIVFTFYLIYSVLICLTGFQLARNREVSQLMLFALFFLAMIVQILLYSYCAQSVKTESVGVSDAIYHGQWIEMDMKHKRLLLIALMRAQRAGIIRGYFFEMNLTSFMKIAQAALSYITLLRSLEQ